MPLAVDHPEPADFIAVALPFLLREEAVNCLLAGMLWRTREQPDALRELYRAVVREGTTIRAVALHTGLRPVLSHAAAAAAVPLLARDLYARQPDAGEVIGPAREVEAFVAAWKGLSGTEPAVIRRERIYRLETVDPPANVPGELRQAEERDRALLVEWTEGFGRDVGDDLPRPTAEAIVDGHLARGTLFVWEDGGVVSMAAAARETPNGAIVNLVYTPAELRGRGYASACVAAMSARLLAGGKRWCFLYTDLANPTTNHIYQQIGYRPVCDVLLSSL
jgi:predicted GNAT family acetyltransferase